MILLGFLVRKWNDLLSLQESSSEGQLTSKWITAKNIIQFLFIAWLAFFNSEKIIFQIESHSRLRPSEAMIAQPKEIRIMDPMLWADNLCSVSYADGVGLVLWSSAA